MADKRLVIAIFETEAAADGAAERLKVTRVVVGDAIAVLVLDERGELKTNKIGATSGGKGATAGLVLGLLGPVGLGVGAVGGGLGFEDGYDQPLVGHGAGPFVAPPRAPRWTAIIGHRRRPRITRYG